MFKFLSITISIQILVHNYVIKEISENTSVTPTNWMLDNNAPYTNTELCAESKVGPFLGPLGSNVKRSFTNVPAHFSITISLDIYYTEYWGTPGNYFEIIFDGTQIFSDSNIMTLTLSSPSAYCSNNDILYLISFINRGIPRNKKLITIQSKILHQNTNYFLEVKGSFYCVLLLPLQSYCERAGIKNLYLYIEECHESCLTCTGPLKTNCLTCPSGVVTAGQCSCGGLFFSKNQCVASCSANEEVVSGYCVESCGTNCLVCLNQICNSCQNGFQLYQGKCMSSCPTYSIINGTNCDDLTTISNFGSEYLGKYFYTLENNIVDDLTPFIFTSSSGNSLLTGQKYCIYGNLFLLGGLGVWADGIFKISFSSLSPHNMVRIQMKLYFIDSWNGEEFVIRVDGVQVYSKTVVSSAQSLNLLFRDAKDLIEPVSLSLPHLTNTLMIEFESKLTQSAFIASAGITDLFVLIDYCDISCAVCGATQCTLCLSPYTQIANKCIICGSDNKRNSNCSCMDGYFDDSQISCQQCPIQCQGCLSLTQCTNCNTSSHFANLPHCTGCELGYYYTTSNDCQQCISNCLICDNSNTCYQCQEGFYQNSSYTCTKCSQNCKICNIGGCQDCESNFALNSELQCVKCNSNETVIAGYCQQCHSQCLTCLDELDNCQSCPFPRINPPNCKCQDGYFESAGQCQICNHLCATCELNQTNCISCAANRINVPKCDCPVGGISQIENGIVWCSTCESAILEVYFSDDLTSLIIDFGTMLYRDEYLNCSQIFIEETVNLLGLQPTCYTNFNQLIILLDYDAKINQNDKINIKDQTNFIFKDCQEPIKYYLNNQVGLPKTSILPKIFFNLQQVNYISGLKIDVQILEEQITGMRKLTLDKWEFLKCSSDCQSSSNILKRLNTQINGTRFQISSDFNFSDTNIILALYFHNFLGQSGQSTIELIVSNKQIELFCNVTLPKQPIHKQKTIYEILLYPYLYDSSQQIQISENMNVTLHLQLYTQSVLVQSQSLNSSTNSYSILNLDTYSLIINQKYQLIISATDNLDFNYSQQMEFIIHEKSPVLYIVGGSRQIGYNQVINLEAVLLNNLTQLNLNWNCLDLGDSKSCSDQNGNLIQFNNSLANTLKSFTFPPYTSYQFNILAHNQNTKSSNSVIMMTIEDNIPQILLSSNVGIKSGAINYYDMIYLNFTYADISTNPDLLLYVGTFYYNSEIIAQVQFKYLNIVISLWDHLDSNQYPKIYFKFIIYNANYLMPSMYTFQLIVNIPPQNCEINSNVTQGYALTDYFDITVLNCEDEDQPLQYKFVVYYSQADIQSDNSIGNIVKGQKLSQFGYQNQMISYLTGDNSIIIMVIVKDQLEGISNYTLNLNISQQDEQIPDYSNLLKESMLNLNIKFIIRDIFIIQKHFEIYNSFSQLILEEMQSDLSKLQENQLDAIDQQDILQLKSKLYIFGLQAQSQQINQQFYFIDDNLASIQDQIHQFRSNNVSENYNLNQFNQKQLNEQIQQSALILNNLQSANLNLQRTQGRLLMEDDKNQNKQLFLNSLSKIENSLSTQQVMNSNTLKINQSEFQISTSKLSQKQLELQFGAISNQTDQYKYSQTIITTNPYYQDSDFKQLTDGIPNVLYMPNLTQIRNNEPITQLNQKIDYIFDITKQQLQNNKVFECASKISNMWSVNVCKNVENGENQRICQCSEISAITLIDAAFELTDNFISLFSLETLLKIEQYDFTSDIFTYTLIAETFIYFILFIRSYQLDKQQNNIQSITKVFPITDTNPKTIIDIGNLVKDEIKPQDKPNERGLIHSPTQYITENQIPTNFMISREKKLRYPTLYQFHSKSSVQKDSDFNQIDPIPIEKIPITSKLALPQKPGTIFKLNQDMAADSPNSIFRTPNYYNNQQKNNHNDNLYNQERDILNSNDNNSHNPSVFENRNQQQCTSVKLYRKKHDSENIIESPRNIPPPLQELQQNKGLIFEISQHHIGLAIGVLQYVKHHHKLLNILYRFDQQNPRITRAILSYISILGQMAILTFFGKIMNLNTILSLSILSSIFGFVYKTSVSYSIKSKNKILNYFGFNLSIISFCLFYFIILASVSKYKSKVQSNFWGIAYLSNQFLDLIVYALIMQITYFTIFVKYGTKPLVKKLGKIILPPEEYGFFYGEEIKIDQGENIQNH